MKMAKGGVLPGYENPVPTQENMKKSSKSTKQIPSEGSSNVFDGNPLRGDDEVAGEYGTYSGCKTLTPSIYSIPGAVVQGNPSITGNGKGVLVSHFPIVPSIEFAGGISFTVPQNYIVKMNVTIRGYVDQFATDQGLLPPQPSQPYEDNMLVTLEAGDYFDMAAGNGGMQVNIVRNQRNYVNKGDIDTIVNSFHYGYSASFNISEVKECSSGEGGSMTDDTDIDDDDSPSIPMTADQRFLLIGALVIGIGSKMIIKRN